MEQNAAALRCIFARKKQKVLGVRITAALFVGLRNILQYSRLVKKIQIQKITFRHCLSIFSVRNQRFDLIEPALKFLLVHKPLLSLSLTFSLQLRPSLERTKKRHFVNIFQIAADRNAACDSRHTDARRLDEL